MNVRIAFNFICKSFLLGLFVSLISLPSMAQKGSKEKGEMYLSRARYFYEKVWNYYRVGKYGLFSEYYPQKHNDTLTYMQQENVQSKEVSYLWPFSGIFGSTSVMMQIPGQKEHYKRYMDSLVEGMEKYRDTTRKPAAYQAYPSFLEMVDRYYDDNGLVGIDYLGAYAINPDPLYLQRAKDVFQFILSGWTGQLGGGVYWLEGHGDQKPACSNGMATLVALKLYQATKDPSYLDWGKRFYQWMQANLKDSVGLYWNDRKTADGSINKTYYTYNSGSMLEASVLLYRFTGDKKYLLEAQAIAKSSYKYFGKKINGNQTSLLDLPWFVLVLFRGYEVLYEEDGNPKYINTIIANLDYAWQHSRDKYGLLNNTWNGNSSEHSKPKWLLDEACIAEFYARIGLIKQKVNQTKRISHKQKN